MRWATSHLGRLSPLRLSVCRSVCPLFPPRRALARAASNRPSIEDGPGNAHKIYELYPVYSFTHILRRVLYHTVASDVWLGSVVALPLSTCISVFLKNSSLAVRSIATFFPSPPLASYTLRTRLSVRQDKKDAPTTTTKASRLHILIYAHFSSSSWSTCAR